VALADLLWACPECGEDRGLRPADGTCHACGTRFVRATGSTIRAIAPDGTVTARPAREWLDRLPDPASLLGTDPDAGDGPVRSADVDIRTVVRDEVVRGEAGYLNQVEVFGEPEPGSLTLDRDRLVVTREGGTAEAWPLEELTAVQASSSSLQLKRRGRPLAAYRFHDDSVYLWEQLLHAALRDFYGRTGRGSIVEFQPRISTR
jgi:hypothetical protein